MYSAKQDQIFKNVRVDFSDTSLKFTFELLFNI